VLIAIGAGALVVPSLLKPLSGQVHHETVCGPSCEPPPPNYWQYLNGTLAKNHATAHAALLSLGRGVTLQQIENVVSAYELPLNANLNLASPPMQSTLGNYIKGLGGTPLTQAQITAIETWASAYFVAPQSFWAAVTNMPLQPGVAQQYNAYLANGLGPLLTAASAMLPTFFWGGSDGPMNYDPYACMAVIGGLLQAGKPWVKLRLLSP